MPFDFDYAAYMDMSPSMLAAQPPTPPELGYKRPDENWDLLFDHNERRLSSLRNWRYSWWAHWASLAEFFLPRRYHWTVTANTMSRGKALNEQIIDCSPLLAVQTCASGMWAGLTPSTKPWFRLAVGLPWIQLDAEAKAWLEDTEARLYTVFSNSNFYTTMAQAFQDVAVFGTAPVIIYEDAIDTIRCYLPCAGEYFLASGGRFSVDTLYREYVLTVAQIVETFQTENCPNQVRVLWEAGGSSIDTEMVVAHAIEPNFALSRRGRQAGRSSAVPAKFTWRETYWLKGQKTEKPLSIRGFYTQPFMTARWSRVSNDPYGRSPCMDALGDTRQVQQETRRKAEYIEKLVRPPMLADPELKNEPSSILPGMITYVNTANGKKGFSAAFEVNAQAFAPLTADIEKTSQRIDRCLFVDVFMAITRMQGVQPRNELEINKRDLERLQQLGPFIELFQAEFAGPAIKRVMDIMQRQRMLTPMPQSLARAGVKIEFESVMRAAQKSSEAISMKDFFQTAGTLSLAAKGAQVPDPIRTVKLDDALKHYGDIVNFSNRFFFTPSEIQSHDQARAAELQKAQQQKTAVPATAATVNAAKTMSETQVPGGGSMLDYLMGTRGGI